MMLLCLVSCIGGKTAESDRHPNPTTNFNLNPYLVAVQSGSLAVLGHSMFTGCHGSTL